MVSDLPWDQRLAGKLVRPLANTFVHPNHLTTLSLMFGMSAALLFALGGMENADIAAGLYILAVFTDHTDGELARLTGKTNPFGHSYDFIVGGVNYTCLFIGLGFSLSQAWSWDLGIPDLNDPGIPALELRPHD